jgi:hypothetical protein
MTAYQHIRRQHTNFINENHHYAITGRVFEWLSEFSELNFMWMTKIIDELYKNADPVNETYSPESIQEIKKNAQCIFDRGGFTALQGNYYTMSNFMGTGENHKIHMYNLNYILDGVGSWVP